MRRTNLQRMKLGALLTALFLLLPVTGLAEQTGEEYTGILEKTVQEAITDQCTIVLPEDCAAAFYRLTDENIETYVALPRKGMVEIALPQTAAGVYLAWYDAPESYAVVFYDAAGTEIERMDETRGMVNCYYDIPAGVDRVVLELPEESSLSTIRVYGEKQEASLQRWETVKTQADMLLVAATPESAARDLYALLAKYDVENDMAVALCVFGRGTRTAQEELLTALWDMGVTDYPFFANCVCRNVENYDLVKKEWGLSQMQRYMGALVRQLHPKVIVTNGIADNAAPAERFTYEIVSECAQYAGSDRWEKKSREAFGTWQVEKFYTAADASENGTTPPLEEALVAFHGTSAVQVAKDAYTRYHVSNQIYVRTLTPATSFALTYTNVGADTAGNDLLENLERAALLSYTEPTPSPTPEPTPEPTPTKAPEDAAEEPTQTTTETDSAAPRDGGLPAFVGYAILGVGVAATVLLVLLKKPWKAYGRRALCWSVSCIPFFAAAIVFAVLQILPGVTATEQQPQITPVVTAAPVPTATPEATQSPEPEPDTTAETKTTGLREATEHFTATDEDEIFVWDADNGHYEYHSDVLSIVIDQHTMEGPVVYFVADIRMRDVDSFRPGLASEKRSGMSVKMPWIMARESGAVLMITGDNLLHMEKQLKGILMREGKIYSDYRGADTMALYPDLSMKIFSPRETSGEELLQDGVRNTFSFGPTLIRDGVVNEDAVKDRNAKINPRVGIGQIEPGHFVAIVVDGRQKEYSIGLTMEDFAALFVEYGCEQAYNLDGGVSACMVFMGEQLNHHGNSRTPGNVNTVTYQRRVPDGLMWGYSSLVPSVDDPIHNDGMW